MTPGEISKDRLVSEIYEVILKPERYDRFMHLWEQYISGAISRLATEGEADFPIEEHIKDPELEVHFQRVYEILEKLGREERGEGSPHDHVAQRSEPALFFNVEGKVVASNEHANRTLGNIDELNQISGLVSTRDFEKLQAMLLDLRSLNLSPQVYVFRLDGSGEKRGGGGHEGLYLARILSFSNSELPLLCVHALGVDWDANFETLLTDAFQLTSSELQIGRYLCRGSSLDEIAMERKRSVHTIRVQVKSMLRKTGTGSQSDLIRVMATLSYLGRSQTGKVAAALERAEFSRQVLVPLRDGRNMPVRQIGAENGRPVLFLHGMLDGSTFCTRVRRAVVKGNIRLIIPARPGFANSPPAYDIETAPEEFARDLRCVMDHLGVAKAPVVGHMGGGVYAYAAAGILQDRISLIFNISGAVPIRSFRQLSSMSRRQRAVAWTARFAPRMLPAILRAGISLIDRGNEDDFMNALYVKGSRDREVVGNADVRKAIFAGYRFTVAQGHRAFEVDSRHVTRDWSEYLVNVRQRVVLVHGVHDPTVTIESVRDFVSRHDGIELVEQEDAGQLLFYQKPKVIVSMLRDLLET